MHKTQTSLSSQRRSLHSAPVGSGVSSTGTLEGIVFRTELLLHYYLYSYSGVVKESINTNTAPEICAKLL